MAHLRQNLDAGWLPAPPTAQLGLGDASALPQSAAQPAWAQVFGNWSTLGGGNGAAPVSETDSGIFIGGDRAMGSGWRLGGALGYTNSQGSLQDRSSSSDVDSYTATLYGGKGFDAGPGRIDLTAGLAYTWHDVHTQRNAVVGADAQTLKATYGASTGQAFTELGYALPLNRRTTLEPFVAADWSDLRTRGFAESGGDEALQGQGDRNDVTTTTLGLHTRMDFQAGQMQGRLRATAGWRHAFGAVTPQSTLAFDSSQPFTVAGAPVARDAAVAGLGVDVVVTRRTTVSLDYDGQFGSGQRQNAGSIDVHWRF
jgi:outer membrane autotransporter protein